MVLQSFFISQHTINKYGRMLSQIDFLDLKVIRAALDDTYDRTARQSAVLSYDYPRFPSIT